MKISLILRSFLNIIIAITSAILKLFRLLKKRNKAPQPVNSIHMTRIGNVFSYLLLSLFLVSFNSVSVYAQCGPGACQVCDVSAEISFIEGGNIVNGFSMVGSSVGPGGVGIADDPLVIQATGCGVISLTVDLSFVWDQGTNINWIHGISFLDSGGWEAAEGLSLIHI